DGGESELGGQRRDRLAFPQDRQRQQPPGPFLISLDLDFAKQDVPTAARYRHSRADPDRSNRLILQPEPPAFLEILRQNVLLQECAVRCGERVDEIATHNQGHVFGHGLGSRRVPGWRFGAFGEQEPVETVRWECQQISQLTDRRKESAGVELDWYAAGE